MSRIAAVLPVLAASAALVLVGCGGAEPVPATAGSAPASAPMTTSPRTSDAPTQRPSGSSGAATGELATTCAAAKVLINDIVQELFDHPNDPKGAAVVYEKGARKMRDLGAGTPVESQINRLAAKMDSIARLGRQGKFSSDTGELTRAAKPLAKACGE